VPVLQHAANAGCVIGIGESVLAQAKQPQEHSDGDRTQQTGKLKQAEVA
jgi:hypothetical protein